MKNITVMSLVLGSFLMVSTPSFADEAANPAAPVAAEQGAVHQDKKEIRKDRKQLRKDRRARRKAAKASSAS